MVKSKIKINIHKGALPAKQKLENGGKRSRPEQHKQITGQRTVTETFVRSVHLIISTR
jgi:hypothetical protein